MTQRIRRRFVCLLTRITVAVVVVLRHVAEEHAEVSGLWARRPVGAVALELAVAAEDVGDHELRSWGLISSHRCFALHLLENRHFS